MDLIADFVSTERSARAELGILFFRHGNFRLAKPGGQLLKQLVGFVRFLPHGKRPGFLEIRQGAGCSLTTGMVTAFLIRSNIFLHCADAVNMLRKNRPGCGESSGIEVGLCVS